MPGFAPGVLSQYRDTQMASSIRLFRLFGITVYLHWTWFLMAAYRLDTARETPLVALCTYVGLFLIVLMHEFGHSLATRQVGGQSNEILLWPFGGIAYINAPNRPGAHLWSIAAGPLVNVALFPILWVLNQFDLGPFANTVLWDLFVINLVLLVFNLLPVYPLDGGQILRTLLWYWVGELRSLKYACIVGLIGSGAGLVYTLVILREWWLALLAGFAFFICWQRYQMVRAYERY